MVTGSVFGKLSEEINYSIHMWKSVCHPTDSPSSQKASTHHVFVSFHYCVVVVTVSGNGYWGKKITETSVNFPPEHSIPPYRHGTHPNVDTHKVDIRVFFSARRLFWFMLYEMTCRSSFKPSLLGSLRSNRGGVKSGLRCGNNAKSLCEKGSSMQR